jgi:hypothetical protein
MRSVCQVRLLPKALLAMVVALGALGASSSFAADGQAFMFKVRIDNISSGHVLKLSSGGNPLFALSPGMWIVYTGGGHVFKSGQKDWGEGLEAQAEDGNPVMLAESLQKHANVKAVGIFNTPVGANGPGPILPGGAYAFELSAKPGIRLTLVTMFGQSNDLFYAPEEPGMALFDKKGQPIHDDLTRRLILWDAGTELNREPGAGPDQAPRQKAANTGVDENGVVRVVKDTFTYPKTADVMRVMITHGMPATAQKR